MRHLAAWLEHLEARNAGQPIALGLTRVQAVADRLGIQPDCPVITVAGTNGKGSTCAFLEAMLTAGGYRVGVYTSPHLLRYNERVRLGGVEADDATLVAAFEAVEAARGETPLTYFEHGTLAALWLFARENLDAWVLEVGLGGRLDAVNVVDADCAIITPIDLDHQDWLGETREAIAREKAGILRAGRPVVISDPQPPQSLLDIAAAMGCPVLRATPLPATFPLPALLGGYQRDNAAAAMMALSCLTDRLPLTQAALRTGVATAQIRGRFQVLGERPLRIVEVGHNPHAARSLASALATFDAASRGRCVAVCAMLADKEAEGVVDALADRFAHWHIAPLPGPRGGTADRLQMALAQRGISFTVHDTVVDAWRTACAEADTIVAFGSFLTAAAVLEMAGA